MKTSYGIVTADRPGQYVHKTIASLQATGFFLMTDPPPLRLQIGHQNTDYLTKYYTDPAFKVRSLSGEEMSDVGFDRLSNGMKSGVGNRACIQGLLSEGSELLAVFEDDLAFAGGWIERLDKIVGDIQNTVGDRWILTMYSSNPIVKDWYEKGMPWFEVVKEQYYGSQAMLYPRAIAQELLQVLTMFIASGTSGTDMAISTYAQLAGVPILCTTPSLVEHMGEISVGCNTGKAHFHRAGYFINPIP